MITLLSPAKDLDMTPVRPIMGTTVPEMLEEAEVIAAKLRTRSAKQLARIMDINADLAQLNHERYQEWAVPFTAKNAKPAILAFNGEVYRGLNASGLGADDLRFAQHHVRILSGLYGVLRPLDLMQAYRLEMGTAFSPKRGARNLYAYWGDRITMRINEALEESGSDVIMHLASAEYFKAIKRGKLKARVIEPVFRDRTRTGYKVVMVYAKQQRGRMARYIITHRLLDPEPLKLYNGDGYRFMPAESTEDKWVFHRD